jgi:hypothetical protein
MECGYVLYANCQVLNLTTRKWTWRQGLADVINIFAPVFNTVKSNRITHQSTFELSWKGIAWEEKQHTILQKKLSSSPSSDNAFEYKQGGFIRNRQQHTHLMHYFRTRRPTQKKVPTVHSSFFLLVLLSPRISSLITYKWCWEKSLCIHCCASALLLPHREK